MTDMRINRTGLPDSEIDEELHADKDYNDKPTLPSPRAVGKITQAFNSDGTVKTVIRATRTDFVHNLIHLDGGKFDFTGRKYLYPIYNRDDSRVLLKTGRQVEKTTFLANNLVVTSAVMPYNKSLYVSPSHSQTRQFSSEKLKPAIEKSPIINRYLQDSKVSSQVFEKGFTNGSYVFLRSAFRSADRSRGIAAKILTLDEIQDLLSSDIPVIMECTSHFPDNRIMMAGTPKSLDNPIEQYWKESSQNEWLVPCESCKHWNFLDEKNIAPTEMYVEAKLPPGPVCSKCMKPIDVRKGQWMALSNKRSVVGYRIPQLMVPWIVGLYDQWLKLLWKRDNYPFGQFNNEVLGLSYDSASKPISRAEVIACCKDYDLWNPSDLTPEVIQEARRLTLTAGIDWGEGNDGSERSPSGKVRYASYTILTIGAYINQRHWRLKLSKKYMGREVDPDYVVKDIVRICRTLGVKIIGADWGHGWGVNNALVRQYGVKRVVQFQHLRLQRARMEWDPDGFRYKLHRNLLMSEQFYDMKNGFFQFPRWKQFEPFAADIFAIYKEYDEFRREIKYDHRSSDPDDFFHSLLYCKLASDLYHGRSRRHTIPDNYSYA